MLNFLPITYSTECYVSQCRVRSMQNTLYVSLWIGHVQSHTVICTCWHSKLEIPLPAALAELSCGFEHDWRSIPYCKCSKMFICRFYVVIGFANGPYHPCSHRHFSHRTSPGNVRCFYLHLQDRAYTLQAIIAGVCFFVDVPSYLHKVDLRQQGRYSGSNSLKRCGGPEAVVSMVYR